MVYQTNLTIGNVVALPDHFHNKSNKKNLIKFDDYDDILCFWRCLVVFNEIMNQSSARLGASASAADAGKPALLARMSGGKIYYRRFEKSAKKLFMKLYNKKYSDDYKEIKYTPYISYYYDETCEDYDKEVKNDKIDKVEDF